LNTTLDLTSGSTVVLANAVADDLTCTATNIPLTLAFTEAALQAAITDGTTPFRDTVTITVAPQ
jgi:hypothetical protein